MATKIFIDGEHGTTGLQIRERLADRGDIEMLSLAHEERHCLEGRIRLLRDADIAILCLPDDAARQSVELVSGTSTRLIDASTAHRTHDDWVFGFAELEAGHQLKIAAAQYVSNPGCYSTGSIALINPLVKAGLLQADHPLTINAVSGYTGGGKGLISQIQDETNDNPITSVFYSYALDLNINTCPKSSPAAG